MCGREYRCMREEEKKIIVIGYLIIILCVYVLRISGSISGHWFSCALHTSNTATVIELLRVSFAVSKKTQGCQFLTGRVFVYLCMECSRLAGHFRLPFSSRDLPCSTTMTFLHVMYTLVARMLYRCKSLNMATKYISKSLCPLSSIERAHAVTNQIAKHQMHSHRSARLNILYKVIFAMFHTRAARADCILSNEGRLVCCEHFCETRNRF